MCLQIGAKDTYICVAAAVATLLISNFSRRRLVPSDASKAVQPEVRHSNKDHIRLATMFGEQLTTYVAEVYKFLLPGNEHVACYIAAC